MTDNTTPKLNPNANLHTANNKRKIIEDDLDNLLYGDNKKNNQPVTKNNLTKYNKNMKILDDQDDDDFSTNLDDRIYKF